MVCLSRNKLAHCSPPPSLPRLPPISDQRSHPQQQQQEGTQGNANGESTPPPRPRNRTTADDALADYRDDNTSASTPKLVDKFQALNSQWSSSPSKPTPPRPHLELQTEKLNNKLKELEQKERKQSGPDNSGGGADDSPVKTIQIESTTPAQANRHRTSESWSVASNESSLGRTTLSSHETLLAKESVFERLYRNERRYTPRVRRNSPEPLDERSEQLFLGSMGSPSNSSTIGSSYSSASLEKRLSYVAPGDVQRLRRQQQRRAEATSNSVSTPKSAKTDSVFERLYRKEPRRKSLITPKRKSMWSASATPRSSQSMQQPLKSASPKVATARSVQTDSRNAAFERLHRGLSSAPPSRSSASVKSTPATSTLRPKYLRTTDSTPIRNNTAASSLSASSRKTSPPVWDRLYQQRQTSRGATPVAGRRSRQSPSSGASVSARSTATAPPQSTSVPRPSSRTPKPRKPTSSAASVTSPASASSSVFERLYRNESRTPSAGVSSHQKRRMASSSSASVGKQTTSPSKIPAPSTGSSRISRRTPSSALVASSTGKDSVFERLYRREPRQPPVSSPTRRHIKDTESSIQTEKMGHVGRKTPHKRDDSGSVKKKRSPNAGSSEESGASSFSNTTPTSLMSTASATTTTNLQQSPTAEQDTTERELMVVGTSFEKFREEAINEEMSILLIQSWIRGNLVRNALEKEATLALPIPQSDWSDDDPDAMPDYRPTQDDYAQVSALCDEFERDFKNSVHEFESLTGKAVGAESAVYTHNDIAAAVRLIQSVWRMSLQKRDFRREKSAAHWLQATWRMRKQRSRFQKDFSTMRLFAALDKVDSTNEARKAWHEVNADDAALHRRFVCATTIQTKWRSLSVRRRFLEFRAAYHQFVVEEDRRLDAAATKIQRQWRRFFIHRAFTEARTAIIVLEALLRGRTARRDLHLFNSASSRIQNWSRWRLQLSAVSREDDFCLQHLWATRIQSTWRCSRARRLYRLNTAARRIQSRWRVRCDHLAFVTELSRRKAAERIQAQLRGKVARLRILKSHAAAAKLQAKCRGVLVRKEIRHSGTAAAVIQRQWNLKVSRARAKEYASRRRCAVVSIQSRWRGSLARMKFRNHVSARRLQSTWRQFYVRLAYVEARVAAAAVQASVRGHRVRTQQHAFNQAAGRIQKGWKRKQHYSQQRNLNATLIQSIWRSYRAKARYYQQRNASTVIQCTWRTFRSRSSFRKTKSLTIMVQALCRGAIARNDQKESRKAVERIEKAWKTHHFRSQMRAGLDNVRRRRASIVLVQTKWRSCLAREQVRRLWSAVEIQRKWRGCVARAELVECRSAASEIQRRWKAHRFRSRLLMNLDNLRLRRTSATQIQSKWRSCMAREELRRGFAAIEIQRLWRGRIALAELRECRAAATAIQASWRSKQARKERVVLLAALKIQRGWKTYRCRTLALADLRFRRTSATKIQAKWRSCMTREEMRHCYASIEIQRKWRGCIARAALFELRSAAGKVQRGWKAHRFRSHLMMKLADLRLRRTSATKVQSKWRSCMAREELRRCYASMEIQRKWRSFVARAEFLFSRKAASKIQRGWKAYRFRTLVLGALDDLRLRRMSATKIQSKWRSCMAREELRRCYASIEIQRKWRSCVAHAEFLACRAAALKIQRGWKTHLFRSHLLVKLSDLWLQRTSVTLIQSKWRSCMAREELRRCFAGIAIQRRWRGCIALARLRAYRSAATAIQASWRVDRARKERLVFVGASKIQRGWKTYRFRTVVLGLLDDLRLRRTSAILIQAKWRSCLARQDIRKYYSSIEIQRQWRGYVARSCLLRDQLAASHVQRGWKAYRLRSKVYARLDDLRRRRYSVILVQAKWRSCVAREHLRMYYASVSVQKMWRGYVARLRLAACRAAATLIQTSWHRYKVIRELLHEHAASEIQRCWKAYRFRSRVCRRLDNLRLRRTKASLIQASWRSFLVREHRRRHLSAIRIQAKWRSCLAREHLRRCFAVIEIQRKWRGYVKRASLDECRSAVIAIQALSRRVLVCDEYRASKEATVMIQRHWKAYRFRSNIRLLRTSASLIQAKWRSCMVREELRCLYASIKIQRKWKGCVAHAELVKCRSAASMIQKGWKAHRFRFCLLVRLADLRLQRTSAAKIQSKWRSRIARQCIRRYYASIEIQRKWRGFVIRTSFDECRSAAISIQSFCRGLLLRRQHQEFQRAVSAASTIQRGWKSHILWSRLRNHLTSSRARRASVSLIQAKWRSCLSLFERLRNLAAIEIQRNLARFRYPWSARRMSVSYHVYSSKLALESCTF